MKIKLPATIAVLMLWGCLTTEAQVIAKLTLPAVNNRISAPVYIDLDAITAVPDSLLMLREVTGTGSTPVAFQVENSYHRYLWWMVGHKNGTAKRVFELVKINAPSVATTPALQLITDKEAVLITENGKNVLQYHFATHYPPAGVDTFFKRSGFIHPLWTPSGNVLTRINPPDHYHHMGLWNPWTHVLFENREVDFWNIGDKKGTVRFRNFISTNSGNVYAGFKALQEHVAFNIPAAGMEKTAMHEVWDIRVYNTGNNMWLCDFTSVLNCAAGSPVVLKEYRYGGFGFRATEAWNNANSRVLTSEGKTRKEADASTARWCMIDGELEKGHSGILFMSFPSNYNFPEPMRVWPVDANKRGDVFFSFSPTRNKDWPLQPQKNYVLKYRMLIYDGTITPQQAEEAWKSFAHPPEVKVENVEM
ncbi:MAG TPA: PmoA family protein [Agriterribacter sp.]|nr:PmoA family protein [Agriterribacter sp.]